MKKIIVGLLLTGLLSQAARAADFEIHQETEFKALLRPDAHLRKLASGIGFGEGPVWVPRDGGYLVFSDIPSNALKKWTEKGGLTDYRKPSLNGNGNTLDLQGRLLTCEHAARSVVIEELDGTVHTLVSEYEGKKLNSPNDIVVKSDGSIWFTDPPYGIDPSQKEQPANYVFRFDTATKSLKAVSSVCEMPNGLCFSPGETKLYLCDSGSQHDLRVFTVSKQNELSGGEVFAVIDSGVPDGIRCDGDGHLWCAAGDGVHILSPDGRMIGKILVPETPANLCFGGERGHTLFITARTSLYAIDLARIPGPELFEKEIKAFETADKTNPPPTGAIVFVGSSSIRKWKTLARDFPGHTVINRGFGGSRMSDLVYYFDRTVTPCQPKAIVFFAGSNDINGGKTPETVFNDFKAFVDKARLELPRAALIYIGTSTSPSRWKDLENVKKANQLISDFIAKDGRMKFIDILPAMLGPDGHPMPECYEADRLHPNARGYAIWKKVIGPYLK